MAQRPLPKTMTDATIPVWRADLAPIIDEIVERYTPKYAAAGLIPPTVAINLRHVRTNIVEPGQPYLEADVTSRTHDDRCIANSHSIISQLESQNSIDDHVNRCNVQHGVERLVAELLEWYIARTPALV